MLRWVRIVAWAAVAFAAIGFVILWRTSAPGSDVPATQSAELAAIGGPFTLTSSDGSRFASERLAGRPHAVFFGFTHCPDVCPTTLARLVKLRRALGKGDRAFEIVFVSVDPERDTPAEMAKYIGLFDAPVIGLTGTAAEIDEVKRSFGAYSEKVPGEDGNYSVDHTATVFLIDRDGTFRATIAPDEGDAPARAKLTALTAT